MSNALIPQYFVLHTFCSLNFIAGLQFFPLKNAKLVFSNTAFATGKKQIKHNNKWSAESKWILAKCQMKMTLNLTNLL